MELTDIEPPSSVRIPIASALYVEKLLREARVERAWMMGSDKNIHVAFQTKGRVFSIGVAQLMTEDDGLTVAVLSIHVGPWSGKDTIAKGLERAGARVEMTFKNDVAATFVNDKDTNFVTVPLRR